MLVSVIVERDPVIVIAEQVEQGLYTVSVEPEPVIVLGVQVGQGL